MFVPIVCFYLAKWFWDVPNFLKLHTGSNEWPFHLFLSIFQFWENKYLNLPMTSFLPTRVILEKTRVKTRCPRWQASHLSPSLFYLYVYAHGLFFTLQSDFGMYQILWNYTQVLMNDHFICFWVFSIMGKKVPKLAHVFDFSPPEWFWKKSVPNSLIFFEGPMNKPSDRSAKIFGFWEFFLQNPIILRRPKLDAQICWLATHRKLSTTRPRLQFFPSRVILKQNCTKFFDFFLGSN